MEGKWARELGPGFLVSEWGDGGRWWHRQLGSARIVLYGMVDIVTWMIGSHPNVNCSLF